MEIDDTFYWRSNSEWKGQDTVTGPCVGGFAALSSLPPTTLAVERNGDGVAVRYTTAAAWQAVPSCEGVGETRRKRAFYRQMDDCAENRYMRKRSSKRTCEWTRYAVWQAIPS